MEVLKMAGFYVESLPDFALRINLFLPSDLNNIFIASRNLHSLLLQVLNTENVTENVSKVSKLRDPLVPIETENLVAKIALHFKQVLNVKTDSYLFYRSDDLSLEPLLKYDDLNAIIKSAVFSQNKMLNVKKRKAKTPMLLAFPEKRQRLSCPDLLDEAEAVGSATGKGQRKISINSILKLRSLLSNEMSKNLNVTSTQIRKDEFTLNRIMYDWKQRTGWAFAHPLHERDAELLLRHIIMTDIVDNPCSLDEWVRTSEDWVSLRQILSAFLASESKISKNNGYGRILKHHLKGVHYGHQRFKPICKTVVSLYISDIMRRVLPLELFGGASQLRKKFMNSLSKVVFGAKDESFLLQPFVNCLNFSSKWLNQIEDYFKEAITMKLMKFLVVQYFLEVIRNNFYLTEAGSTGFELHYYRKNDIESVSILTLNSLISNGYLREVSEVENCRERQWLNGYKIGRENIEQGDFLNISSQYIQPLAKMRFLPKSPTDETLRIITIAPRIKKIPPKLRIFSERRRQRILQTKIVKLWLQCFLGRNSTGIRPVPGDPSLAEAWEKTCRLKECSGEKLYFVKADIVDAFGSILHGKLFSDLSSVVPDYGKFVMPEYTINEWGARCGKLVMLTRQSFSRKLKRNRLLHSRSAGKTKHCLQHVKSVIKQIVTGQLLRFGKKTFIVIKGLSQGGVGSLSPALCDFYYSALDRRYFDSFLCDERCIFLRAVDDYLLISPDREKVLKFYVMVQNGIPDYNTYFKTEKLATNLMEDCNTFNYVGLHFDVNSLVVGPVYDKYSNGILHAMKLSCPSQSQHFRKVSFIKKKLRFVSSLKIVEIVFKSRNKDPRLIRKAIFGACVIQSMRIFELSHHFQASTSQLIVILHSAPLRLFRLVRRFSESTTQKEVEYIFWQIVFILSQKYAGRFRGLITFIKLRLLFFVRMFNGEQTSMLLEFLNEDLDEIMRDCNCMRWRQCV